MARLLFFSTLVISLLSVGLSFWVFFSPQWITLEIPPEALAAMTGANMDASTQFLSQLRMTLSKGVSTRSFSFMAFHVTISSGVTLEGIFFIIGLSIFCLGVLFIFPTGYLMNMDRLKQSSPWAKLMSKCATVSLQAGSGILLAGVAAFTVSQTKGTDQERLADFMTSLNEDVMTSIPQFMDDDSTNEVNQYKVLQEMLKLEIVYDWCYYVAWVAGTFSLIASIMMYFISDGMGKLSAYEFEYSETSPGNDFESKQEAKTEEAV